MRGIPPRNGSHAIRPTMEVGSDFWKFFRGRRRLNARTRPNELGRREAADQRPPQSAKSPGNPGSCRLRERLLRMHLKKIARIRTIDGNGRLRLLEIYSGRRRLSARTRRNELARREAADQRPPQSAKSLGNPRSCRLGRKSSSDRTSAWWWTQSARTCLHVHVALFRRDKQGRFSRMVICKALSAAETLADSGG